MDELTPMDSEFRELPPEQPNQPPCSYGTGRLPEAPKSKVPLIAILVALLITSNIVTLVFMELVQDRVEQAQKNHPTDASVQPAQLQIDTENTLTLGQIYDKILPSLAIITAQDGSSVGTGIVLSQDGYVLTNASAVSGALLLYVSLPEHSLLPAELIGSVSVCDLAVLKVDASDLTAAELGNTEGLHPGDTVISVNYPFGADFEPTMNSGLLSSIDTDFRAYGQTITVLQSNAPLSGGNIGGPLLNTAGQLVAFNVANVGEYRSYETVEQIGFSVSLGDLSELFRDFASEEEEPSASLGITAAELSPRIRRLYGLPEGLYVEAISLYSNAYASGLRRGDTIVSIDGMATPDFETYQAILRSYRPGEVVEIILYRQGLYYRANVELNASD